MHGYSVFPADIPCLGTIGIHLLLIFAGPVIRGRAQGLHYQLAQLENRRCSFGKIGQKEVPS